MDISKKIMRTKHRSTKLEKTGIDTGSPYWQNNDFGFSSYLYFRDTFKMGFLILYLFIISINTKAVIITDNPDLVLYQKIDELSDNNYIFTTKSANTRIVISFMT
uniref:Uncharacterized protein n=1 Tax=Rhizophagus irregularis (strain DAOM 181602 / DAOM 197198 / MUCL 43194) TaxID=747089 RepID=U9U5Q7_RHIID